jgi:hypothetical protein
VRLSLSGQRVQEGGGVMSDQWLQRWRDFRSRHPDYPKIDVAAAVLQSAD